jgi:Putative transposase
VIYRSKLHATLKRNFQVMPGVEWLELLCKHVPDRHAHMVRYYGRYSSRTCGSEHERPDIDEPAPETHSQLRQAAKTAWAKIIRTVYEVDPLGLPQVRLADARNRPDRRSARDRAHPVLARALGPAAGLRAFTQGESAHLPPPKIRVANPQMPPHLVCRAGQRY